MAILMVVKALPWMKIAKGVLTAAEITVGVLSPIVAGPVVLQLLNSCVSKVKPGK